MPLRIFLAILLFFLQSKTITHGDDLIDSPIFDVRPESESLKEVKNNIETYDKDLKNKKEFNLKKDKSNNQQSNLHYIKHILSKFLSTLRRNKRKVGSVMDKQNIARNKRKESKIAAKKPEWHKWTDWSKCSVTCGKGRVIRWRHCQGNCDGIETEMEEMACQLPECPRKLFGVIKLKK